MRQILITLGFLLALGCSEAKVTAGDLVGTWVMTEDSRQYLSEHQTASAKFVLNENGDFLASQIPSGLLYLSSKGHPSLVTGSGVWKMSQGESQQLQLEFRTLDANKSGVPFGAQMFISGSGADIRIFYYQGDPDEGIRIKFQKLSDGEKSSGARQGNPG